MSEKPKTRNQKPETPTAAPRSRRAWLVLAMIVLAAFGIRAAVGFHHIWLFDDSQDYTILAQRILNGQPYEVHDLRASRMPGYPVLLAGLSAAFGPGDRVVIVAQAVMGALCAALAYLLGRRLSPVIGLLAAALVAVDPLSVAFSATVLSEVPFTLVMLFGLWVALRAVECRRQGQGTVGWWVLLGVVWGIATYLRGEVMWGILAVGLWAVITTLQPTGQPARLKAVLQTAAAIIVAIALMLLVLSPWMARYARLFGGPYGRLTTLEGLSLYEAVYPEADGGPRQDKIAIPEELAGMGEGRRDEAWRSRAWAAIRADPGRMLRLAMVKSARTWSPWLNAAGFAGPATQAALAIWHLLLYALALLGALISVRLPRMSSNNAKPPPPPTAWPGSSVAGLALLIIAYFTALHALFLGSVRYRVPLMPLIDLLAAAGLVWLMRKLNPFSRARSEGGGGGRPAS